MSSRALQLNLMVKSSMSTYRRAGVKQNYSISPSELHTTILTLWAENYILSKFFRVKSVVLLDMKLDLPQSRSGYGTSQKISYSWRQLNPFHLIHGWSVYTMSYPGYILKQKLKHITDKSSFNVRSVWERYIPHKCVGAQNLFRAL
jgi:hypothetical protein